MDATEKYPNDANAILETYKVLANGNFESPDRLKSVFPSLDNFKYKYKYKYKYKDKWWVIDIGGNNLRLIAFIQFRDNRMYVKHIVTHAQYDKLCKMYKKRGKR